MTDEGLHSQDSFCSKCGAVLTKYAEGYRDTCLECLPDSAAEDDGPGDTGYMGPTGLQREYWD